MNRIVPIRLRRLMGNPSRRPIPETPEPEPGRPECPASLDEEGRIIFERLADELEKMTVLTEPDQVALATLARAWSDMVRATRILDEMPDDKWSYQNDLHRIVNQASLRVTRLCGEFGLTPSGRARIRMPPKKAGDELAQFLDDGGDAASAKQA